MTHTVEGWAVQWTTRNGAAGLLCDKGDVLIFKSKKVAAGNAVALASHKIWTTRIVRVRQTTEVIE